MKKRLDQLGIALKLGKNVRRNRPVAVRIRTHVSGRMKRPVLQKEPAPSVFGLSSAGKLTALPEEAEHPRTNNRQSLAQYQQETVRQIQPMDTKGTSTATHPGQVKATKSNAIETPLGPSKLEGDPNSSEDKRDTIPKRSSANPCQALVNSPATGDDVTPPARMQTLGTDGSGELGNRVASPSEPRKRGNWKSSFKMVIHLAKGADAFRLTCLDTGANVNVISIDVVNSLALAKERYQGPRLKPINGIYLPQWQVTFDWHVAKFPKTYTSTFAVLDEEHSADFDILLGEKTIGIVGFYDVNPKIWFHTTIGSTLPSIELDK